MVYKVNYDVTTRPKITQSKDSYKAFLESWNMNSIEIQEEFKIILINNANRVLAISTISRGGMAGTIVDIRLIFATAIKLCASGIIVAHNHPSGELKPSEIDIRTTKKLVDAGLLLDIKVLDHLIISKRGYYSFGDQGMI